MQSTTFPRAAYDLRLVPPDEDDELDEESRRWQDYCRVAKTLNRQHLLDAMLTALDGGEESPLYEWIDDACDSPYEPGRAPKNSVDELQRLGRVVLQCIATAVDHAVNLRLVVEG